MENEVNEVNNEIKNISKRTIIYGAAGILLCVLVILGILLAVAFGRTSKISRENKEYAAQMKEMEEAMVQKDQTIESDQATIAELQKSGEELNQKITEYETQLATVEELNNKINELMNSYNELLTEHEKSKTEVESLKGQVAALTAERDELSKKVKGMEADIAEGIVYWVDDGNAYHTKPQCPMISGSENIKSGTIADSGKNAACIFCS